MKPVHRFAFTTAVSLCAWMPSVAHAADDCIVGARVRVDSSKAAGTVLARTTVSCRVHFDDGSPDRWFNEWEVKAASNAAGPASGAAAEATDRPRPGKYVCLGYNGVGSGAGTFRWYVTLTGDQYRQTVPDLEPGRFLFDRSTQTLSFTSGPYSRNGWMGLYSVEREGKTHRIVLRDMAKQAQGPRVGEFGNFYCTNSTDSEH